MGGIGVAGQLACPGAAGTRGLVSDRRAHSALACSPLSRLRQIARSRRYAANNASMPRPLAKTSRSELRSPGFLVDCRDHRALMIRLCNSVRDVLLVESGTTPGWQITSDLLSPLTATHSPSYGIASYSLSLRERARVRAETASSPDSWPSAP